MKHAVVQYLLVGVAGALGAMTRLGISQLFARTAFPIGTLLINITGSFLLGWFLTYAGARLGISDHVRIAIAVGFIGAYTTFSTFTYESMRMIEDGTFGRALLYIGSSLLLGLLAVSVGILVGRHT